MYASNCVNVILLINYRFFLFISHFLEKCMFVTEELRGNSLYFMNQSCKLLQSLQLELKLNKLTYETSFNYPRKCLLVLLLLLL